MTNERESKPDNVHTSELFFGLSSPLSKQALARIEAAKEEAGADLLNGLAAFWSRIGVSTKALKEHDPLELVPLFERFAEKQFDAQAEELLPCFPDVVTYSERLTLLVAEIVAGICPPDVSATKWEELYRSLKVDLKERGQLGGTFQQPFGDWENYVARSFSHQLLTKSAARPETGSYLTFLLKYACYLRLVANHERFMERLITYFSEPLHRWRAKKHRQLADALEAGHHAPVRPRLDFETPPKIWDEVHIRFFDDTAERVEITVGAEFRTCTFKELGFEDGRKRPPHPNRLWQMLQRFAEGRGRVQNKRGYGEAGAKEYSRCEKAVQELRPALQELFGLEGNPILFVNEVYEAQFHIRIDA